MSVPDPDSSFPAEPAGRLLKGGLLFCAALGAGIGALWVYAEWGDRVSDYGWPRLVSEYRAWKNRPKPLHRCEVSVNASGKACFDEDGVVSEVAGGPLDHDYQERTAARFQDYSRCRELDLRIPGELGGEYAWHWLSLASWFESSRVSLTDGFDNITGEVGLTKVRDVYRLSHYEWDTMAWVRVERLPFGEIRVGLPDGETRVLEPESLPGLLAEIAEAARLHDPRFKPDCLCVEMAVSREDRVADWLELTRLSHTPDVRIIAYDLVGRPRARRPRWEYHYTNMAKLRGAADDPAAPVRPPVR